MRDVESRKIWREFFPKKRPFYLDTIYIADTQNIRSLKIDLTAPLTAICGSNGVGKTTILKVIKSLFSPSQAVPARDILIPGRAFVQFRKGTNATITLRREFLPLPPDAKIASIATESDVEGDDNQGVELSPPLARDEAHGQTGSFEPNFTIDSNTPEPPSLLEVISIDAASDCSHHLKVLSTKENVSELRQGVEPHLATPVELDQLNYILGRNYSSLETFELEGDRDDETIPYFVVTESNKQYSSLTMGAGELAVHYSLWALRRIEEPSVVVIEEPETFIAPFSQANLLNIIASIALKNGGWFIIVTHSPVVLARFPLRHIRILSRFNGLVSVRTPINTQELGSSLGVTPIIKCIIFVEDIRGTHFLMAIFQYLNCGFSREVEIVSALGESTITTLLTSMPNAPKLVKVFGVYDGDQRGKTVATHCGFGFLPGNTPPEVLIKGVVNSNLPQIARAIDRSESQVAAILASVEGANPHDWFVRFAQECLITPQEMMALVTRICMQDEAFRKQAQDLCQSLENTLTAPE